MWIVWSVLGKRRSCLASSPLCLTPLHVLSRAISLHWGSKSRSHPVDVVGRKSEAAVMEVPPYTACVSYPWKRNAALANKGKRAEEFERESFVGPSWTS